MGAFFREFKDFAMRGNVMDMALGVVIGTAFGKIISSLVANVIMPPIGFLIGGVNFGDLALELMPARDGVPANILQYGLFIQAVVDFSIVAFTIFLVIKSINALKKKKEAVAPAPPPPSTEEKLLVEIRDLLKKH